MARKEPERNIWQWLADECSRAPYDRDAGRVLYGEHDVEHWYVVPGQDADGNLVFGGYESEPVTNPVLVRWVDALLAFESREHHDAAPLIALLEPDAETLPIVGIWLADLVWRHGIECDRGEPRHLLACALKNFKPSPPKAGRPKGAAYDMPDHIAELNIDNERVSDHLETHGGSVDDAVAAFSRKKHPHDPEAQSRYAVTLKNFRERRHNSARQAAKRRI